jgi:hypothetical protein
MRHILVLSLALSAALALMAGCETFLSDDDGADDAALLEEYGGFYPVDEAPWFGDADLLETYPDEQPFEDDMANHPQVINAEGNRGAKQYALRIVWGNIDARDTASAGTNDCPVSDWSGSVSVNGGVLVVERLIRFEPGDRVLKPRRGPHEVEWVSHTSNHVDGIVLKIIDVPDPAHTDYANTVEIVTPFYRASMDISELQDYRVFVEHDDCNKASLVATEVHPTRCPGGFMEGRWITETDTSGYFKGVWIGRQGDHVGYLRGRFTVRDGYRVLYGKWITRSGEFAGLLRGRWMPMDLKPGPDGHFEGRWVDENYTVDGFFRGHYCTCDEDSSGFFHGRWIKDCR